MATERIDDLRSFRDFLDERLSSDVGLTLTEVLVQWEIENQTEEELDETLRAIERGFADIEAGRVMPAQEATEELLRKYTRPSVG